MKELLFKVSLILGLLFSTGCADQCEKISYGRERSLPATEDGELACFYDGSLYDVSRTQEFRRSCADEGRISKLWWVKFELAKGTRALVCLDKKTTSAWIPEAANLP